MIQTFRIARLRWLPMVVLLASSPAFAHDGPDHDHPPVKVPDATAYRPTAIPDRILLTWTGDTAHTQAVTWRTDDSVHKPIAQVALASAAPKFTEKAAEVKATTRKLETNLGTALYHTAVFGDLKPSTLYAYRVGDGVNWSEWFHFRTANDKAEPFSFIYFGDAQNDIKSLWSRVIRGAYSDIPNSKFIIHAGDLVNRGDNDAEWGEWHGAGGWVNGMVPSIPTPGNHEYPRPTILNDAEAKAWAETRLKLEEEAKAANKPFDAKAAFEKFGPKPRLTSHWAATFALPDNGPEGLKSSVYYVDYQGTRIISLNSNERRQEQVAWLDQTLSHNPSRWTVITFHHPVYSAAKNRDNKELRDLWQPVFDKYKVDIVLTGHDHTYARSGLRVYDNLPTGTNARDGESGTVYVVSVSGPKMYNLDKEPWMKRAAEDTQLYQTISIDGDRLIYQAKTATGELYDAFDLLKRDGQPNQLVEKAPKTPEKLRIPQKPADAPKVPAAAAR